MLRNCSPLTFRKCYMCSEITAYHRRRSVSSNSIACNVARLMMLHTIPSLRQRRND